MYKSIQVYKYTFLSLLMFCMPNGAKQMLFFIFNSIEPLPMGMKS